MNNSKNISKTLACLLFAALLCLLSDFSFVGEKFSYLSKSNSDNLAYNIFIFALEIFCEFYILFSLFYLCSFNKNLFRFVIIFLSFISGFSAYCFNNFNIIIDPIVIANLSDNANDVSDVFIFSSALIYFTFFVIFPAFLLLKFDFKKQNITHKFLADNNLRQVIAALYGKASNSKTIFLTFATCFLFLALSLSQLNHAVRKNIIFAYPPLSQMKSVVKYYDEVRAAEVETSALQPINEKVSAKNSDRKAKNLKVVLIIGESARAKNFSIDGYERKTTPQIEKIKNFLSFKNVTPASNLTAYSVSYMLLEQDKNHFHFPINEQPITKIFEKLGFATSWFSTQKAIGDNNSLMILASTTQNFYFADKIASKIGGKMIYDEYLLDDLQQELSKPRDSFIILHTQGSHFLFNERYPDNFKIFTPACENKNLKKCSKQEIVNSYDNSILYTDFFIASAIEALHESNALLIYISDHGQFLGENEIFYHGPSNSVNADEHKVPMFFWASDKLLQNKFYQEKFVSAQKKVNENLSHDVLFGTLLSCSGIEFEGGDKNESLCD